MKSTTYKKPWETITQKNPPILWDGETRTFSIFLSGLLTKNLRKKSKAKDSLEVNFSPPVTYIVRIKEVGMANWIIGIETSLTGCTFCNLKPNTGV